MSRMMRCLLAAGLLLQLLAGFGTARVNAQPALQDNGWLPFDGRSAPGQPVLTLLDFGPSQVLLSADLPGAYVEAVEHDGAAYSRLSGEGYAKAAKTGLPDLPILRKQVEVPAGAQVTLEIVRADAVVLTLAEAGLHPIYPLQPSRPKTGAAPDFAIDPEYYTSGTVYPQSPVTLGERYMMRGHNLQTVEVWPVAYDPAAETVTLYRQVEFRLALNGTDLAASRATLQRYASPDFDAILKDSVLNFNLGLKIEPEDVIGYLIVVADAYYDAIQPFVALKESRGFEVTTVKTSEIPGGATALNIQAYIKNAYDTWPIPPAYVLLVGDTNTVPTWTGPEIGTSTDLYYAGMDGTGTSDWHPNLGRGRFPVRSPEQATNMVNKYLLYAGLTGQEDWIDRAAFPATCDNYTVAEGTHNYVIDNHTAPDGFYGRFPTDPQPGGDKLYCVTYGATQADVIEATNDGRSMVIYSGHGSYDGWELLNQSAVPNLVNFGMPSFVASHACLTGDFGQAEVFGETWVLQPNKGALAFWGSSTYSYWDEDDWLERAAFDSLFSEPYAHARLTEMTDAGLLNVEQNSPGMAQYYWETYNILGDPSVKIFLQPDLPMFDLSVEPQAVEICNAGVVTGTATISSIGGYSETVYLENGELPPYVTVELDPVSGQAPYESDLTLEITPDSLAGLVTVEITATDNVSYTQSRAIELAIVKEPPAPVSLLAPANGSFNQPFTPAFDWTDGELASSYGFQLARNAEFADLLVDESGLIVSSYQMGSPLDGGTCHWWRVTGENACGVGEWTDPFYFATVNLQVGFYDDMESGMGNWTHQAAQGVDHWTISEAQSHSPTHAWFVPDDGAVTDTRLWNTIAVNVGAGSELSFWHKYAFEGTSYDGSVLEISTDGGGTWSDLGAFITQNGYNGTISTGYSNPLGGREGWVGDLGDWSEVVVDLSSFAGSSVQIRWRLGCDSSVSDTGWYIDDVQITQPMPLLDPPGMFGISPDQGYADEATPVTITGDHFTGMPSLLLGDTWLQDVVVVSPTQLTAIVPAGMEPGLYGLTLYNGDCQDVFVPDVFTVLPAGLGVTLENSSPAEVNTPVLFVATISGETPPVEYAWDFGGPGSGSGMDGPTPIFTYTAVGEFVATVVVTDQLTSASATTNVIITAPPEPGIAVSPLAFTATVPFEGVWIEPLVITNTGTANLEFTLTDNATWLTSAVTSALVLPEEGLLFNLTLAAEGLVPGVHNAEIEINHNVPQVPAVIVGVTLIVEPPHEAEIEVEPDFFGVDLYEGQSLTEQLEVSNLGEMILTFEISETLAWLVLEPATGGELGFGESQAYTVSIDSIGLAPAVYTGTILITSNDSDENPLYLPVRLTVNPAPPLPAIVLTPAEIEVTLGLTETGTAELVISNAGTADLIWYTFTQEVRSWLEVTGVPTLPVTLAPGEAITLTLHFDSAGLAPGDDTALLIFDSDDPADPSVTVPVTLHVVEPPVYQAYLPVLLKAYRTP